VQRPPSRCWRRLGRPAEPGGGLGVQPGDAIEHQLGEEGVEVDEVPVQYALGEANERGG
jgi:hypothetical protein